MRERVRKTSANACLYNLTKNRNVGLNLFLNQIKKNEKD